MGYRTLKLKHEEIELLQVALLRTYGDSIEKIRELKDVNGPQLTKELLENCERFHNLLDSISNGDFDV